MQHLSAVAEDSNIGSDLFDVYFDLLEDTENPTMFHRWTMISCIAAALGRSFYLPFGVDEIYPNVYVVLIGASASRKSHAISAGRKILRLSGYEKFACSKTSKEKFIEDLAIGFDNIAQTPEESLENLLNVPEEERDPCEVLISAGELEDFMGRNNGEFISMLTNLYDPQPSYSIRKIRSASTYVHQPTINLIGGATNTTFNNTFPPEIAGQGFLSRMILAYGGQARQRIAWPSEPDGDVLAYIAAMLRKIRRSVKGRAKVSPEATQALAEIYETYIPIDDVRFESYNGRRHVHLLKLCLIHAAADLRTTIEYKDVLLANTVLSWTESLMPKALGEFGKAKYGEVTTKIIELCASHTTDPLSLPDIYKAVSQDFDKRDDFHSIIKKLMETDKISTIKIDGIVRFIAVERDYLQGRPHIKLDMLKEYLEFKAKEQL